MATVLQIVGDNDVILFDLNDPTGANNADGIRTALPLEGSFALGVGESEPVILSPASVDGGFVVSNRTGLGVATWQQFIRAASGATTPDTLIAAIGELGRLLAQGGVIKFIPDTSTQTRYIDFEPSPTPAIYEGQAYELNTLTQVFAKNEGIHLRILRQPYLRGTELAPALNLVTNPTLTHDFGGTANRPDDWAWSGTTGLSAESITDDQHGVRRGCYQFTKADGTAASLQQTTVDNSYASGDVGVFSFYARVVSGGTAKMRATLQFQTNAAGNIGGLHSGTLTTLTSAWQRISVVSSAAGATTGQAQVSIQIDNDDATSTTLQVCNAQAEKTAASGFRVPAAAVAFDPSSTSLPRKYAVWADGNAPTSAKFQVASDANGIREYRMYRVADQRAVDVLQATLHKELEDGTLTGGTASAADTEAVGDDTAEVTYSEPDPAFGTDAVASGTGTSIALAAPASLAEGNLLVTIITRGQINAQIAPPDEGWQLVGTQAESTGNMVMAAWFKIADATDVATSTFTFTVIHPPGGSPSSFRGWIGRFSNVDQGSPLDTFEFATETGTAITAPDITTSADDALIITAYAARIAAEVGTLTWTAPAGSTPTYTEQDDGTMDVTYRGQAIYTGVLATAGATGTKDGTASASSNAIALNMAFRKAPAVLATRSTVTFASLPPGDYDVWLRYRTTAACRDRLRVEFNIGASPATWVALPDVIVDTLGASTFTQYQMRNVGRIHIPEEFTTTTLTVRVSAGREQTSAAAMRLDTVWLGPAFELAATLSSPTQLATTELLASDAAEAVVFHLDSSSQTMERGGCAGPAPLLMEPGYQVLLGFPMQSPVAGFVDNAADVDGSSTVTVTHTPHYRA